MEGEVQNEESKVSLDVNKKRTVKTQAQVNALESFYKEHKFLSDEMKAQLAVQIDLTEKQISSWFCHRRLKDKKRDESFANGRQDHSSGVIQDRGSGHRQDSCGSIKQGGYRNVDPREVESRRVKSYDSPSADPKYDHRSIQNPVPMHDTSSESSSSLHDQLLSENRNSYDLKFSVKNMGYKPSGYLKVKGENENPAITAVKRQLGRYYREDGPLLGIEFDLLPAGAFEFPSSKWVNAEQMYVEDSLQAHSPDTFRGLKQLNLNIINEVHGSKMSSQDSYMEAANLNSVHGSQRQAKYHNQFKYKSSFHCSNPFPGQNSLDIYEGSSGKTVSDCKGNRMTSKSAIERMGSDSCSNLPGVYDGIIFNERVKPLPLNVDNRTYKAPKNKSLSKPSNLLCGYSDSLGSERGPSAIMVEKLGAGWKAKMEYPVTVKNDSINECKVPKRVKGEYPQQDVPNASHVKRPVITNPTKGPSFTDIPSSFSEDETAETSSSLG